MLITRDNGYMEYHIIEFLNTTFVSTEAHVWSEFSVIKWNVGYMTALRFLCCGNQYICAKQNGSTIQAQVSILADLLSPSIQKGP